MPTDYTDTPTRELLEKLIAAYDETIRRATQRRADAIAQLKALEQSDDISK